MVHCCCDCGNVVPHTPSPPSTPRKTPNIPQSITDTHQKSPPPEGCPTAGQVCVRRRFAAATPWMQIWMLRGESAAAWIREEDGNNRRWLTVSLPARLQEDNRSSCDTNGEKSERKRRRLQTASDAEQPHIRSYFAWLKATPEAEKCPRSCRRSSADSSVCSSGWLSLRDSTHRPD